MLAIDLREFNSLTLLLVLNIRFHGLLVVFSLHVTVWLVVCWDIHDRRTLCQLTSGRIGTSLFVFLKGRGPIRDHRTDICIAATLCSGFRDGAVAIAS